MFLCIKGLQSFSSTNFDALNLAAPFGKRICSTPLLKALAKENICTEIFSLVRFLQKFMIYLQNKLLCLFVNVMLFLLVNKLIFCLQTLSVNCVSSLASG